jgi:hypothetical protein
VLLHDGEDLDDDLGRGSDHDLSLSSSLSVDDVVLKVSTYSSAFSGFHLLFGLLQQATLHVHSVALLLANRPPKILPPAMIVQKI